jgi:hypothetical protein
MGNWSCYKYVEYNWQWSLIHVCWCRSSFCPPVERDLNVMHVAGNKTGTSCASSCFLVIFTSITILRELLCLSYHDSIFAMRTCWSCAGVAESVSWIARDGDRIPRRQDFSHPSRSALPPPTAIFSSGGEATGPRRWPPATIYRRSSRNSTALFLYLCVYMACFRVHFTFYVREYLYLFTLTIVSVTDRWLWGQYAVIIISISMIIIMRKNSEMKWVLSE